MMTSTQRPPWVPEEEFPFESRFAEIDGCDVHYVDEGSGPPILFLHGNPTWSFLYRKIISGLTSDYRCIALDYPGFGLSRARVGYGFSPADHASVVQQLVQKLDLTGLTLMGQDWGGPIGLAAATREPDRFRGLVLGNTWAWPLNGQFHFEAFARAWAGPLGRLLIRNTNAFVNVLIPLGTAARLPKEVMTAYRGPFPGKSERMATYELPKALLVSRDFMETLQRDLDHIAHLPTLLIWGGADFALRKRVELPRFESLFPNHRTVIIDGAKHFFQEDAPQRVVDELRRWMQDSS